MKAFIIQPPLVQLNTPYPSGAYLSSFFKSSGFETVWYDLSNALFHKIFSKDGLKLLFEKSSLSAQKKLDKAIKSGDENTASNLISFLSQKDKWILWIDTIVSILCDGKNGGREASHSFIFSPHAPRGFRMENFLAELNREVSTDDARFLASMALSDLADYISFVFDSEFSLVRYGESLAVNESTFSQIENKISSPVMETFYKPLLEEKFEKEIREKKDDEKILFVISVPFAGTFPAALYTSSFIKNNFGKNAFVSVGGGFINTELREIADLSFGKYFDAISYDRGYGSYKELFDRGLLKNECVPLKKEECFYKLKIFAKDFVTAFHEKECKSKIFEEEVTAFNVPDYSDIDFSLYPRMLDDTNPMQRLWSDGAWLKAYLAHGCYWHQCDFCDVNLDYVSGFQQTRVEKIYESLEKTSRGKGIKGIHFVDEAIPPNLAGKFALLNTRGKAGFSWWGNVRFEKIFTRDYADFLALGGLTAVSAGIEIATGKGLSSIHKGTDLEGIVSACCAFKEAGILVHAYMIYGYWNQSEEDTINSMETLRQFYEEGLLDCSFWHKFVLTRHSRIYSEWKEGKHPFLRPLEDEKKGIFAKNGMHFEGEEKSAPYASGLNRALNAWMHGEGLKRNVTKWFDFKVAEPSVPKDMIKKAVSEYERKRDFSWQNDFDLNKIWWAGGNIVPLENYSLASWTYMNEQESVKLTEEFSGQEGFKKLLSLLNALSLFADEDERKNMISYIEKEFKESKKEESLKKLLRKLKGRGLLCIPFVL